MSELPNNNGIVIYGAGPIDLGKDVPNWRGDLIELFKAIDSDAVMFDPSTSYKISLFGTQADRRDDYIEQVNKAALEAADVMVVVMPHGVQSIGTPIEIDMAHKAGMPIYLVTNIPRGKSVYLNNRIDAQSWMRVTDINNPIEIARALEAVRDSILRDRQVGVI